MTPRLHVLTLALVLALGAGVRADMPSPEATTLRTVYTLLGGASWIANTGWMVPPSPGAPACAWFSKDPSGVCETSNDYAAHIDLDANNVFGVLGDAAWQALASLTRMHMLDLGKNPLFGTIYSQIHTLSLLDTLDLQETSISGTIPTTLGALAPMRFLFLNSNAGLRGTVPSELAQLTALEYLVLSTTSLSGAVPSSLWTLPELLYIEFGNAWDTTLPDSVRPSVTFPDATTLNSMPPAKWQQVSLTTTNVNGALPSELFRHFSQLTTFNAFSARLVGTLPDEFDTATMLTEFRVDNNALTGALPPSLLRRATLEKLMLPENPDLGGELTADLLEATSLRDLQFHDTRVSGVLPDLSVFTQLTRISGYSSSLSGTLPSGSYPTTLAKLLLQQTSLSGTIPTSLSTATALTELRLDDTDVVGTLLNEWAQLSALVTLRIDSTSISGTLPVSLFSDLPNLKTLIVSGSQISGIVPTEVALATQLTTFEIENVAGLTGQLPPQLFSMPMLETLNVGGTSLTGSIPLSLWSSTFQKLEAPDTSLSGALPSAGDPVGALRRININGAEQFTGVLNDFPFSNATKLGGLFIGGVNSISGSLPTTIGFAAEMSALSVAATSISGVVPTELGTLTSLTFLDLSYTSLTGTIPTELGQLTRMMRFRIVQNNLGGTIPSELGRMTVVSDFHLGDLSLSGTVPTELALVLAEIGSADSDHKFSLRNLGTVTGELTDDWLNPLQSLDSGYCDLGDISMWTCAPTPVLMAANNAACFPTPAPTPTLADCAGSPPTPPTPTPTPVPVGPTPSPLPPPDANGISFASTSSAPVVASAVSGTPVVLNVVGERTPPTPGQPPRPVDVISVQTTVDELDAAAAGPNGTLVLTASQSQLGEGNAESTSNASVTLRSPVVELNSTVAVAGTVRVCMLEVETPLDECGVPRSNAPPTCLAFWDEQTRGWRCTADGNETLDRENGANGDVLVCGSTTHFTPFVLLSPSDASGAPPSPCSDGGGGDGGGGLSTPMLIGIAIAVGVLVLVVIVGIVVLVRRHSETFGGAGATNTMQMSAIEHRLARGDSEAAIHVPASSSYSVDSGAGGGGAAVTNVAWARDATMTPAQVHAHTEASNPLW